MEAVNVIELAILDNKESLTNVAVGGKQFKEIQRPDIIRRMPYSKSRVYFTPDATIVRKINDPFGKNESGIITVLPTLYRMDFGSESIDKQY